MTTTPAASITLANGCVVRVGDTVPMTDGVEVEILEVDGDSAERPIRINAYFEWPHVSHIDLAKLATLRPAAPDLRAVEGLAVTLPRDLVENAVHRLNMSDFSIDRECAAELSAALAGAKEGGRG